MTSLLWLALAPAQAAGTCTITAEGAPARELDCARAALWELSCKVRAKGKRRVRFEIPEWGVEAETRLPLSTGEQFRVTLLGPDGSPGAVVIDGLNPQNTSQLASALRLCRPQSPPATLRVRVTEHQATGFAEEVDKNGVINRVPTYSKGKVVATAEASIRPSAFQAVASRPAEPARGKLTVRRGESWVDLRWDGDKQWVPAPGGAVTLLRLDFPVGQVEAALGPGDAPALLADDLSRWLAGDPDNRLGLVAWRRSEITAPIAEVPSFDLGPGGWRRANGGTVALAVGPLDDATVRVAVAFRSAPLDDAARGAIEATWSAARSN